MKHPVCCALLLVVGGAEALPGEVTSHPPMRPLWNASAKPLGAGPAKFVDAARGDDGHDGSQAQPWRTINYALRQLAPGDTLYLRGGVYYEHVSIPVSGSPGQPITIRSMPAELAIIDGGLSEFYQHPATAWQPYEAGATDEFVSTKTYPQFGARPIVSAFPAAGWEPFYGKENERPVVLGHFGDSMVPLHGYRTAADLRDDSMLWDVDSKFQQDAGIYCGPGLWFNRQTQRIHVRLAHTTLAGLGAHAYGGPTDPRQLPLCISGPYGEDVLRINGVQHVTVQDVVLRGGSSSPLVNLYGSDHITLDGVELYGGSPGLLVKASSHWKVIHCAFRGLAAPWSSRASMKYRGVPSYRIISQRAKPESHDCEIAYCEFTDDHDGVWVRYIRNLRFHHNLVDNFNDDGIEVGARKHDHQIYVYQNLISRCLLTFTLHEMDHNESPSEVEPDSGVYITRNVIDLRRGVFKSLPREPDPSGAFLTGGTTLCGDHGSPNWPDYYFYHNTVLRQDSAWRGYYGFGMGGRGTRNNRRRVLNNIFAQVEGVPGLAFGSGPDDILVDGNLHWGMQEGPKFAGDFFAQQSRKMAFRRTPLPEAWMVHDQFADPRFENLPEDPAAAADVRLAADSPAIDSGVAVPDRWFDPLRDADAEAPDLGALPAGQEPWSVGVRGRIKIGRH